jgi:hypothetical protein
LGVKNQVFNNSLENKDSLKILILGLVLSLVKYEPMITFQRSFIVLLKALSDQELVSSVKIISKAITAAHASFKFLITGMYSFLSKGNLHNLQSSRVLLSISTTIKSLLTLFLSISFLIQ